MVALKAQPSKPARVLCAPPRDFFPAIVTLYKRVVASVFTALAAPDKRDVVGAGVCHFLPLSSPSCLICDINHAMPQHPPSITAR